MAGYPMMSVMRAAIAGGPAAALVTSPYLRGLAVDAADTYYADFSVGAIMRVAVDGGTPTALSVMKVSRAGGAPVALVSNQPGIATLALDATSVYWNTADSLRKVAK